MSTLVISLLLLAAAADAPPDVEPGTPDEALAQLKGCGFSEVSTRYEDDQQDNVLVIADASATDGQLECAARVHVESGYWTEVPEALRTRYFAHFDRLSAEASKQWALRELEARGELDRLPVYEAGKTNDAEFARKLEKLCGGKAQGMLQSEYGPHAISPAWPGDRVDFRQTSEALGCVMRFSAAAGFSLGLIGNEKAVQPSGGQ